MKKLLFAVVLLCAPAFGQNGLVPLTPVFLGPAGAPRLGANLTITFCTSTATGAPCSPLAQAYSDSTNSFPINQSINPLKTDALGNPPAFYAAPGQYSYTISGPSIAAPQGPYQITVSCIPGSTCAALASNNTWTGTNAFNGPTSIPGGTSASFSGAVTATAHNVSTHADRQIILQNSDFENDTLSGGMPSGWVALPGTAPTVSYETSTQAPNKTQSLKLTNNGTNGEGLRSVSAFSVIPGDTYSITAMAKSDGTGVASLGLACYKNVPSGGFFTFVAYAGAQATTTSTSWTTLTTSGVVPATAFLCVPALQDGTSAASSVWFDQISVQKTDFPGRVIIAGPSPWIDITAPPYLAKCDGSTDDTTAINAAISAASGGGVVFIPTDKICKFSSTIPSTSMNNVSLESIYTGDNSTRAQLLYTGTASPAINMSGQGNALRNIAVAYNNASFTGTLISFDSGVLSENGTIDTAQLFAIGGIKTAGVIISLNNTIDTVINNTPINGGVIGIRGTNGGFSNRISITNNSINGGSGNFTGNLIVNPGQGWKIGGNTFELLGFANTQTAIDASLAGCNGCDISGNWFGDAPAGYTGTIIKAGAGNGENIAGNYIVGGTSNLGTAIATAAAGNGYSVTGNFFGNLSVGISFPSNNQQGVLVQGNWLGSVTTFASGTPSNGMVEFGGGVSGAAFYGTVAIPVATGTAPLTVTSTTPVANLAAGPTLYNSAGSQYTNSHMVADRCTLGTNCSVTLSGSAVFTSNATYQCGCADTTSAAACKVALTSGTALVITGTGTDVIQYVCAGN